MAHPKDKARSILRRLAAEERERKALEGYVAGRRYVDIAEEIHVSPKSIPGIIKRGLERRAAEEGPTVAAARWLYTERLERLIETWWPIAMGLGQIDEGDPATQRQPDLRAAELVLKLATQVATVQNAATPAPPPALGGDINVFAVLPDNPDSARQQILAVLAGIRAKEAAVDAELAGVGTSHAELTGAEQDDDKPPPPTIEGKVIEA